MAQQITVSLTYVISDGKLKNGAKTSWKEAQDIPIDYLGKHGTRINKNVEMQQLWNVKLPTDRPDHKKEVAKGYRTEDGFTAFNGEKINYTRGEAIKKARSFEGKAIKDLG